MKEQLQHLVSVKTKFLLECPSACYLNECWFALIKCPHYLIEIYSGEHRGIW